MTHIFKDDIAIKAFHRKLQSARSSTEVNNSLYEQLKTYGIDTYSMTCYHKNGPMKTSLSKQTSVMYMHASDCFRLWSEHYKAENYADIDSIFDAAKKTNMPIFWDIENKIESTSTQTEKNMLLEADQFGLVQGLSIPINHYNGEQSIFTLAQTKGQTLLDMRGNMQYKLLIIAHYYDNFLRQALLRELAPIANKFNLSQRQTQCLILTGKGLSVDDIAKKLCISARTVNFHIQKMNKTLNTKNKYMSVAKARELDLMIPYGGICGQEQLSSLDTVADEY